MKKKAIYEDKDFCLYEDLSFIDKKTNTKRNINEEVFYYPSDMTDDLLKVYLHNKEKKDGYKKGKVYIMKFSPQEEAEGDHRTIYITDTKKLLIEDFNYYTMFLIKDQKEIYGLKIEESIDAINNNKKKKINKKNI